VYWFEKVHSLSMLLNIIIIQSFVNLNHFEMLNDMSRFSNLFHIMVVGLYLRKKCMGF
jgi:hypothetical protein